MKEKDKGTQLGEQAALLLTKNLCLLNILKNKTIISLKYTANQQQIPQIRQNSIITKINKKKKRLDIKIREFTSPRVG